MVRRHHRTLNMLDGPLFSNILRFAIPLVLANLLQLMYNAADMVVVGRFAENGAAALAAVGATSPVTGILNNIGGGFAVGISVLIAQYIGADDRRSVFETVHTALGIGFIGGACIGAAGVLLSRPLLTMMGTPADVMDGAVLYMRINMAAQLVALPFAFIAGIFRAAGNTTRPTLILCCTGILNVLLNLLFVIGFGMGVEGVALATLFANVVNLVWGFWSLMHTDGIHKLYAREIKIYKTQLGKILKIGIPTMIQASVYNVSNLFVQASLNTFPSYVGAGNVASANFNGFLGTAMGTLSAANLTFTGQNVGAKKYERLGRINGTCSLMAVAIGVVNAALILVGPLVLQLYTTDPRAIEAGMARMIFADTWMFLYYISDVQIGSLRAMGRSTLAMVLSMIGSVGVQLVWILTVFRIWFPTSLPALYLCYPTSFLLNCITAGTAFLVVNRRLKKQL